MPFFFAERDGDHALIRDADARHLTRSLRVRDGEELQVVDLKGFLLTIRVDSISPSLVSGLIVAEQEHRPEPARRVVVAIAQLPAASLDLVLSRCTEVGAAAFQIVSADRSVARGSRMERWQSICREAAMLAGRLHVPEVAGPSPLDEVIDENAVMLVRGADNTIPSSGDITLLIGPEGGWSERELAMVPAQATLGPRNLRADTAAIVATAIAVGSGS
ncbi:MAG TPA: RsmE family RNA methyltransferase [Candidatus Dormibacteraeota bacterium]